MLLPASSTFTTSPRRMTFQVDPMTDPDPGDAVQLQIEYVQAGSLFTGVPTAVGNFERYP